MSCTGQYNQNLMSQ